MLHNHLAAIFSLNVYKSFHCRGNEGTVVNERFHRFLNKKLSGLNIVSWHLFELYLMWIITEWNTLLVFFSLIILRDILTSFYCFSSAFRLRLDVPIFCFNRQKESEWVTPLPEGMSNPFAPELDNEVNELSRNFGMKFYYHSISPIFLFCFLN